MHQHHGRFTCALDGRKPNKVAGHHRLRLALAPDAQLLPK
jgi:hypothetical protein